MASKEFMLHVHLHKINLQIRVSCLISAYLSMDNEKVLICSDIPVKGRETYIDASISKSFILLTDPVKDKVEQKNFSLIITLATSNSNYVRAGVAKFQLNKLSKQQSRLILPLEQCLDKNAQIEASLYYQLLREEHIKTESLVKSRRLVKELEELREQDILSSPSLQLQTSQPKLQISRQIKSFKNDFLQSLLRPNKKVSLKSDRQCYNNNGKYEENSKSRFFDSDKDLKASQKKCQQLTIDLKNANSRIQRLEKSLRQALLQSKTYLEKYEDLSQTNNHAQRRNEFKQSSLKEQIKVLTEKLSTSQSEKQSLIFEKNTLINEFQEREKALRASLRQRQRALIDQKNNLAKKYEQISKELVQCTTNLKQSEVKIEYFLKQAHDQVKKYEALEYESLNLKRQISQIQEHSLLQKAKIQELEQIILQYQEVEQQRKKLRKKITDLQQEKLKIQMSIANLEANRQKNVKLKEESQLLLKEKVIELKKLKRQYDEIIQINDGLIKTIEQKQKKIQQLTKIKQNEHLQLQNVNSQLRQLEKKYLQQSRMVKKDLKDRQNIIKNLNQEINESQEAAKICDKKINYLNCQIEQLNNRLMNLDQEHDESKERQASQLQKITELQERIEASKRQSESLSQKLNRQIKNKEAQIRKLEQTLKKLQSNTTSQQEEYTFQISCLQEKIKNHQSQIAAHLIQIQNLENTIKIFQQEKNQSEASSEETNYSLKMKINEVKFLKQTIERNNQDIIHLNQSISDFSIKNQRLNEVIADLQKTAKDLKNQLNETTKEKQIIQLELNYKIEQSQTNIKILEEEIATFTKQNNSLIKQLKDLKDSFQAQSSQNEELKERINNLQKSIKSQEQEFALKSTHQSKQLQQQSLNLNHLITELKQKLKRQANTVIELNGKLSESKSESKQNQRRTNVQIKRLNSQLERLNNQLSKQGKQIDQKVIQITKLIQNEGALKEKLQQANTDIKALKQLNQNIRKRNQSASQKEKELENTINSLKNGQYQLNSKQSDLQKSLKEKSTELTNAKQQNFKLEKEKQKLIQQLQIVKALIKVKEDTINNMEQNAQREFQERGTVEQRTKQLQNTVVEQQKKYKKEIFILNQSKEKYNKELETTKLKLEAIKLEFMKQQKNSQVSTKQLEDELKNLQTKNQQLQDKITSMTKTLTQQEKARAIEDEYIKPIRDNMQMLKGHLAEYSRTGDQFESNKNKLLKTASTKAESLTQKLFNDKMKDFNLAYNKFKLFVLGCQISVQEKQRIGAEIKKVQATLDRVLRGQR